MAEKKYTMEPITLNKLSKLLIKEGTPKADPAFREVSAGLRSQIEKLIIENQQELTISCCIEFCCVSWCCIQIV